MGTTKAGAIRIVSKSIRKVGRQGVVAHWDEMIVEWTEHLITRLSPSNPWYVGRPLLVTANDYASNLFNGDTGIVVARADGDIRAAFGHGSGLPSTR